MVMLAVATLLGGSARAGEGVLELPSGRLVRGRGLWSPFPAGPKPDFGVYLLSKPPIPPDVPGCLGDCLR